MTVPMNPESPHAPAVFTTEARPQGRTRMTHRRGFLVGAIAVVGLAVVVLVLVAPSLTAPIGTGAGVVAAVVPLVQRLGRSGGAGDGAAGEP